jgi:hypothetical protein
MHVIGTVGRWCGGRLCVGAWSEANEEEKQASRAAEWGAKGSSFIESLELLSRGGIE